jgi:hypothetical protein
MTASSSPGRARPRLYSPRRMASGGRMGRARTSREFDGDDGGAEGDQPGWHTTGPADTDVRAAAQASRRGSVTCCPLQMASAAWDMHVARTMMNHRIRYAFLALAVSAFASGCMTTPKGDDEHGETTLKSVVADYKETSGKTYVDCGEVFVTCDPESQPGVVQACLLDAFAACTPAHALIKAGTIEGGSISTALLVEPDGKGGCGIVIFVDPTQDPWSKQELTRAECTTVSLASCGDLAADGCGAAQTY